MTFEELPSYSSFSDSLRSLVDTLRREEGSPVLGGYRRGKIIISGRWPGGLVVVGDIHGDYSSLVKVLKTAEEELGDYVIVFLGDYVDRGDPEDQVRVLAEIAELKSSHGERAVLLRGNHEPPEYLPVYPHDYPYALKQVYGWEEGSKLYELSRELFEALPHAIVIKGAALLLHGGPPTSGFDRSVEEYLGWSGDPAIVEEVLWNDPGEIEAERLPNPRGAGWVWGPGVTGRVLEKLSVATIVRGHEPANAGYKWNHDGRVLTVFSRLGAPYFNDRAAFLMCEGLEALAEDPSLCIRVFR